MPETEEKDLEIARQLANCERRVRLCGWVAAALVAELTLYSTMVAAFPRQPLLYSLIVSGLFLIASYGLFKSIAKFDFVAKEARYEIDVGRTPKTKKLKDVPGFSTRLTVGRSTVNHYRLALVVLILITLTISAKPIVFSEAIQDELQVTVNERQIASIVQAINDLKLTAPDKTISVSVSVRADRDQAEFMFESIYFNVNESRGHRVNAQIRKVAEKVRAKIDGRDCSVWAVGLRDSQFEKYRPRLGEERASFVAEELGNNLDIPVEVKIESLEDAKVEIFYNDGDNDVSNRRVDVLVECL